MCDNTQPHSRVLQGIPVSQGVAVGQLWSTQSALDLNDIEEILLAKFDRAAEIDRFVQALQQTRKDILNFKNTYSSSVLLDVYISILDSSLLQDTVIKLITLGYWAPFALKKTIEQFISDFEKIENLYLRSRSTDVLDLGKRILMYLQQKPTLKFSDAHFPDAIILMTHDLSIASLADIPKSRLKGIISSKGSDSSHIAILAKSMGIPAVMGVTDVPLNISELSEILINGTTGEVTLFPTLEMIDTMQDLIQTQKTAHDISKPIIENLPITLHVNTDIYSDMEQAIDLGAQGVGLYRTEVAFMMHDQFPNELTQQKIYTQVLSRFSPYPVSIRVLDVGADKPLPYFTPSLELRGIRLMLAHPDIFLSQLRAMLRASEGLNNLNIVLPMIASILDVEDSLALIDTAYQEIRKQIDIPYPHIGAMIEVPCAIFQIESIMQRVDFVSVGSNDLIQYLLATDRATSQCSSFYDFLHPAVLKALSIVVQSAHRHNKKISICGEMAHSPMAAIVLLGLEFDILSMQAQNLPIISSVLRYFTVEQARDLVKELLQMDHARDIYLHLENALSQSGLGF